MSAAETLLKLLSFAADAAPEILPALHGLIKAFSQVHKIDLGPEPPDGSRFDAVDKKIDAERKR